MEVMQFRDFVFRHNPAKITVRSVNETASHLCPGRGEVLQQLGARGRTVRCEGSFFGASYAGALAQLLEFRQKSADGARGMLYVPGHAPFMACLTELVFDAQGDGKIIPYTMLFTEAGEVTA